MICLYLQGCKCQNQGVNIKYLQTQNHICEKWLSLQSTASFQRIVGNCAAQSWNRKDCKRWRILHIPTLSFAALLCARVFQVIQCISCFQNRTVWFKTTCPTQSSSVRGDRVAVAGELGPRNAASYAMHQCAECGSPKEPNISNGSLRVRRPCLCWSHQLHEITRTGKKRYGSDSRPVGYRALAHVYETKTVKNERRCKQRTGKAIISRATNPHRIDWVSQIAKNRFVMAFDPTRIEPGMFWNGQLHLHSKLQTANPHN